MDNSSFPKIFDFKKKLFPDKQLLNLKTWFAKYDFTVQHIKGDKNLIPDFLTRPSIESPFLISSIKTIPIIAMYRSLPFKALTQKAFPLNLTFQSAFQIQDFAKKFLYRYFVNVHRTRPKGFRLYVWNTCSSLASPFFQASPSLKMSYGTCGVSQPCLLQNLFFLSYQPFNISLPQIMHPHFSGRSLNGFHHSPGGVSNCKIYLTFIS